MKKLVVATVAIMLVCLSQAASFVWQDNGTFNTANPGPNFDGYTGPSVSFVLVFLGTSPATIGNLQWDSSLNQPLVGTIKSWASGSYDYINGKAAYTYTAAAVGINGYYSVIAVDAATSTRYGADNFQVSGLTDLSPTPTIYASSFAGPPVGTDANEYTSVPEPASMALFGIGAGVLALRRRFQKKA